VSAAAQLATGLAAACGAVLLLTLAVLPAGRRRVPLSRLDPSAAVPASALAGAGATAGAAIERALAQRGRLATWTARLEQAGVAMALPDLVLLVGLGTVAAGLLGTALGGVVLGLVAAVLVPLATRAVLRLRTSRRRAAFADQLDDTLQLMASSMRAGHSLLRSLDTVSQESESPTAEEFARVVNETRVGRDLTDSLDEVAARMGSDDFSWIAQAIAIHREVGGNLAEVLDAVSHTIRERNALRRQVKALAAEGKLSAIVLMALPFVVSGFLLLTSPGFITRFTDSGLGWVMLLAAGVLLLIGGLWLKKMVSIRF
jgi:tight adherence protein B